MSEPFTAPAARLTLAGAQTAANAAIARARRIGVPITVAVVDDGGHLLVLLRDGTPWSTVDFALVKARTAAAFGAPTLALAELLNRLNLGTQAAIHGGMTTMGGGEPLMLDGHKVGAIAASGASQEQDIEIARAGLAALA